MESRLKVYGNDLCRDCRRAKQYLDAHGIDYHWVDVEANPDEIETIKRYNDGRQTIPVIVFPDGTHLTEPSDAELATKLDVAGLSNVKR